MKRIWKRVFTTIILLVVVMFSFAFAFGAHFFAKSEGVVFSPKKYYRVEFYRPGFPYLFSFDKQYPNFVKIYDNRTGALLDESDIFDVNGGNGEIVWPSTVVPEIVIGNSVSLRAIPEPK